MSIIEGMIVYGVTNTSMSIKYCHYNNYISTITNLFTSDDTSSSTTDTPPSTPLVTPSESNEPDVEQSISGSKLVHYYII